MSHSRIPSPARSLGAPVTPRRYKSRTRSVGSPARSTNSGRLSALIQFKENNKDSFALSPAPSRRSVLNDDTDIEEPRRRSWWKKLADNSKDVMEVLNDNKVLETNEAVEEFIDIEVLSQEKKNYSIDIPESSDSESISSIVIPQRKLFTQKDHAQNKFNQLIGTRETLAKLHKSHVADKSVNVAPKNLFGQGKKTRSKPVFPAALLNLSPNKTANKTKENVAAEVKGQVRTLFGNRAGTKRKNMFADFIVSESEDEISEIQPKVFGFPKKVDMRRDSGSSRGKREHSPTSSVTTDIEMDDWKMLPSSTMVENQIEDMMTVKTPVKRARLSKLAETTKLDTRTTADQIVKGPPNEEELICDNNVEHKSGQNEENQEQLMPDQHEFEEFEDEDSDKQNNIHLQNSKSKHIEEKEKAIGRNKLNQECIQNKSKSKLTGTNESDKKYNADQIEKEQSDEEPELKYDDDDDDVDKCKPNEQNQEQLMPDHHEFEKVENKDNDEQYNIQSQNSRIKDTEAKDTTMKRNKVNQECIQNKSHGHLQNISIGQVQNLNRSKIEAVKVSELKKNEEGPQEQDEQAQEESESQRESDIDEREIDTEDPEESDKDDHNETEEEVQNESEVNEQNDDSDEHRMAIEDQEENEEEHDESKKEVENGCEVKDQEGGEGNAQDQSDAEAQNESLAKAQNKSAAKMQKSILETENYEDHEKNENEEEMQEEKAYMQDEVDFQNKSAKIQEEIEDDDQKDSAKMQEDAQSKSHKTEEERKDKDKNGSGEIQKETEDYEQNESAEVQDDEQDESAVQEEMKDDEQDESAVQEELEDDEQDESAVQEETEDDEKDESVVQEEMEDDEQDESAVQEEMEDDEQDESAAQEEMEDNEQNESAEMQEEMKDDEQNESAEIQEEMEDDEQNESADTHDENYEMEEDVQNASQEAQEESEDEIQDSNGQQESDNEQELCDKTHDTTGPYRKKNVTEVHSPEAILHDKTNQLESFTAQGRNTSIRKTTMLKDLNIRPSLAPPRESTGLSDGTRNSSAEGSGWDSHRTTRKTLRQTFGRDFTPRKSLRALVMEKSAKRQTAVNETTSVTAKFPQANSTELPEASVAPDHTEIAAESIHDVSKRTRQTTLEMYLQKIKKQNMERNLKMEEAVRNSLKAPTKDVLNPFKVPSKPIFSSRKPNKVASKPKAKQIKSTLIPLENLPAEVIEDMKYKPPKRFQPSNASWITKRLYKFLENKLESKYDYKARVRAEKLVETIYHFAKDLRRVEVAPSAAVDALKQEMARLDIVKTHFDFYQFFHEYMPREIRVKVVPDVVNKINVPRHGVFSDIIRGNTVQG